MSWDDPGEPQSPVPRLHFKNGCIVRHHADRRATTPSSVALTRAQAVNGVSPGLYCSPRTAGRPGPPAHHPYYAAEARGNRGIARTVRFTTYVTGQVIAVDGSRSMRPAMDPS